MAEGWTLEERREAAKIAMTVSMAVTVFSAPYIRYNRNMRLTHTVAGLCLVATTVWHNTLYSIGEKGAVRSKRLPPEEPSSKKD